MWHLNRSRLAAVADLSRGFGFLPTADEGRVACAVRTIDTDNAYAIVCRALHDLGNHVVKAQYRHTETIDALASAPTAMGCVLVR